MVEGFWIHQVLSLTYIIFVGFSLKDCYCGGLSEHFHEVSTPKPDKLKKPKLLVFNLDMVIWPFRVETDIITPVKKHKKTGRVTDFLKKPLGLYEDAVDTLSYLYRRKYRLAAISDSPDLETNTKLLQFFNLYNYFPIQEIFGGPKRDHLELIQRTTQIPHNEIFFFDRNSSELSVIRKMGVFVIELTDGLGLIDFKSALKRYNKIAESTDSSL